MAIEIRNPGEDELHAAMSAGEASFGEQLKDEDFERHRKTMPLDRFFVAYDGGRPVANASAYPFTLTVPGGELPTGGVTWVGVLPSHRRRGILRQLMRRQLDDLHEREEPLAILWASEAAIYGRFGYGMAAPATRIDAERARFAFRDDGGATGSVRLIDRDEARQVLPPLYDSVRREIPGFVARDEGWWEAYRLSDPEHWRRGAGPKFFALLELDGEPAGYAIYRIKSGWEDGYSTSQLLVGDAFVTSGAASRELWRFLFGVDLVARVQGRVDPGLPLFLMVTDPRNVQLRVTDGLWLRLVDLEAALAGRTYGADTSVVMQVRDEFCAWNDGRWRTGPDPARTEEAAELELDIADLASVYLGAFDFHALAAAQRVRVLRAGALERASDLFRTVRPPYCPEDF